MTSTIDTQATTTTTPVEEQWRRLTWPEAVALYLPSSLRRSWFVHQVPLIAVSAITVIIAIVHWRSAFIDEALYINAGYDYLTQWAGGPTAPDHGAVFSGTPFLYPVLAAMVDWVGGLYAVRLVSLIFALIAIWGVAALTREITDSAPAGVLAAAVYGWTGPVIFTGWLGTFDAATQALLVWACMFAVRPGRHKLRSAVIAGLLAAVAVAVKYTAVIFLPVVVGLALLYATSANADQQHSAARVIGAGIRRAMVTLGASLGLLALAWLAFGDAIREGVLFTTAHRTAMSPTTIDVLLAEWMLVLLLPMLLGVAGTFALWTQGWRARCVALGLFLASIALPVGQMRMGEDTSFQKHLAYSALFIAPLAGAALARLAKGTWRYGPVAIVLLCLVVPGGARAGALFSSWTDVSPVLTWMDRHHDSGVYLSSASPALKYHARDREDITWDTTFDLYAGGTEKIEQAVDNGRYAVIIVRPGPSGSPVQDAGQETLINALEAEKQYTKATLRGDQQGPWWVYSKVGS